MPWRTFVAAWAFIAVLGIGDVSHAARPAEQKSKSASLDYQSPAARLVEAALAAEAAGRIDTRDALLQQAIDADPNYAAAHWHRGEINVAGDWLSIDDAMKRGLAQGTVFEYNNRRNAAGGSAAEQLAVAQWCRQQGLTEQHRAHAMLALAADPASTEARTELGLRPYNGIWLTSAEASDREQKAKEDEASFKRWKKQLTRSLSDLKSKRESVRGPADDKLRALNDPSAIPAIERILSIDSREAALAAVAAISNMSEQSATESLVRHAVLSPWEDVRQAAAEALRARSLYSYAPLLLAGLQAPMEVQFSFVEEGFGSWRYRCTLFREGPMADSAMDLQVRVRPTLQPRADGRNSDPRQDTVVFVPSTEEGLARSQQLSQEQFGVNDATVREANERARELNGRIGHALKVAARAELKTSAESAKSDKAKKPKSNKLDNEGADKIDSLADSNHPRKWWEWWFDHNDIYYTGARPVEDSYYQYQATYQPVVISQRLEPSGTSGSGSSGGRFNRTGSTGPRANTSLVTAECFVGETPVWTPAGPARIDLIRPGDLVLAQHPETGELAYKPVLATTVRPATQILRIEIDAGALLATRGHPLWVSGQGWRMARELKPGDLLHTADGPREIQRIEPAPKAPAYNLVVDGFNTYFAGEDRVLAHDNNLRQPTETVVPGLSAQLLASSPQTRALIDRS